MLLRWPRLLSLVLFLVLLLTGPGPVSATAYFDMDSKVTAQLMNERGMCWSVELDSARRNDPQIFKGKAP